MADDCTRNFDPLKLVREGTSQAGRHSAALDPASAPADGRSVADGMVFARSYAGLLNLFGKNNLVVSDWSALFGSDVSVPLAVAAIEDVDAYKTTTNAWFDYLNNADNAAKTARLRDRLGYLYDAIGTLALALDGLKETLPPEIALKATLRNLISVQLAPAFRRLVSYYKAGVEPAVDLVNIVAPSPAVLILRTEVGTFQDTLATGLSADWSGGADWAGYEGAIAADDTVYGPAGTIFDRINHCATHNLFRSIFDQFLKAFARTVSDAKAALDGTLTGWDRHAPHYALFLAFLRLLDYARQSGNRLTGRHLDFYYRTILGLAEKPAEPGRVHLLAELGKQALTHEFEPCLLFKAGKDTAGKDAFFAAAADTVANQAKVAGLKTLYRHGGEPVGGSAIHSGRLFASPVTNSGDGLGGPIDGADGSWHPFFNKTYVDGDLDAIAMPEAEIGFAVASHYLLMAEGSRQIYLGFEATGAPNTDFATDVSCFLTTEKGWLEKPASYFGPFFGYLLLQVELTGADPAIVPYSPKIHGYAFETSQPMLLVKLKQDDTRPYAYPAMEAIQVSSVYVPVVASGLRTLAVSNDFGPVDTSKPFQPFGATPINASSLVIGSKEIFQKKLDSASIQIGWQNAPTAYPNAAAMPKVKTEFLTAGSWSSTSIAERSADSTSFSLSSDLDKPVLEEADFSPNAFYGTQSRQGYVRLKLTGDFGQAAYQAALIDWLSAPSGNQPGPIPVAPVAETLTMSYTATAQLVLNSAVEDVFEKRQGQFFHLTPFGAAEQHPYLSAGAPVTLLPQFSFVRDSVPLASEAEFYVGISGLRPPQNLTLLFQVVDGTANPLAEKPKPHVDWSYLTGNRWVPFDKTDVQDATGELLNAGIVTLAMPREASDANSLLPAGMHWIRAAVHERSDAVCRLQLVAAQALQAVFADRGNAPGFSSAPLPAGTISKLVTPDPEVKSISQPYPSFGGRGAEDPQAFYTRISERLRHKDRAITLWDYEHLILEAFPQIYKVKCLNHTQFDPSESGGGIYRELAPGHVTLVTIPQLQGQTFRDPLKPYTSLGVLQEIESFAGRRNSCFAKMHVRNPQFEEVRLSFSVRLFDGFDEAHSVVQLQQAITRFLSPWAFGGGSPTFGGKVYKSVLIDFVEDQPSVDYVTDFKVFRDINGVDGSSDLDEVEGSLAVSILVSAPASRHAINVLHPAIDARALEDCGCEA